jgi:DNA-directed RNA polymerase specialized sigma24 family protein
MKSRFSSDDINQEILYELKRTNRLLGNLAVRDAETMVEKVALLAQMGFSTKEIATILNMTAQTVSVRLQKARSIARAEGKRR